MTNLSVSVFGNVFQHHIGACSINYCRSMRVLRTGKTPGKRGIDVFADLCVVLPPSTLAHDITISCCSGSKAVVSVVVLAFLFSDLGTRCSCLRGRASLPV